jgi:hypothetical protein
MTKAEIIATTLHAMRRDEDPIHAVESSVHLLDEYENFVVATLIERLPDGDIATCDDFHHIQAGCCSICHTLYPQDDMYIAVTGRGQKAWVCCSARLRLVNRVALPLDEPHYLIR